MASTLRVAPHGVRWAGGQGCRSACSGEGGKVSSAQRAAGERGVHRAAQGPGDRAGVLVHPLEEVQPVEAVSAPRSAPASWDAGEEVLWASTDLPYLVTYSHVSPQGTAG